MEASSVSVASQGEAILNLLEASLLLISLYIIETRTVPRAIMGYRIQAGVLAIISLFTAVPVLQEGHVILASGLVFLPISLFSLIKYALASATIPEFHLPWDKILYRKAEKLWRQADFRREKEASGRTMLFYVLLALFAFIIVFRSLPLSGAMQQTQRIGVAVAITLQLSGLYTMLAKKDMISQVIGLLMMDHGMYLAMVRLAPFPHPGAAFLWALYFYTALTLLLLFFLVPHLGKLTGSADLDLIERSSELKG